MKTRFYGRSKEVLEIPDLMELQTRSYQEFLQAEVPYPDRKNTGLEAILREVFPIQSFDGTKSLEYLHYELGQPRYSPDGKSFAFIQRSAGKYSLASMELASRQVQILTDGQLDGSPTFAPNGRLILYASIVRGRGILAAVSSDGRIKQKITASAQDVREPAWGPLMR